MASPKKNRHTPKITIALVLLFTMLASACMGESTPSITPPVLTATQNEPPIVTTAVIIPTSDSSEEFIQPTKTAEPACLKESGRIEHYQFDSKIIGKPQQVNVYLPPCYDSRLKEGYPALILLHGQGQDENFWLGAGLAETSDHVIQLQKTVPYVVIMPYEEYYLEDILQSRFGAMVIDELLPWADDTLALREGQPYRAIGGNSRGAYWAFRLALKNWDKFGAVGVHSMPFFGEPNALRIWLEQIPHNKIPRVRMDSGDRDRYLKDAIEFESLLDRYQVPHEWHLSEGEHDTAYWQRNLEEYLLWYAQSWGE